jgi:hypothetical protein
MFGVILYLHEYINQKHPFKEKKNRKTLNDCIARESNIGRED